jgi:hypothetical protein
MARPGDQFTIVLHRSHPRQQCHYSRQPGTRRIRPARARDLRGAAAFACNLATMVGWRQCAERSKELPAEFFRQGDPRCRVCVREGQQRVAPGVIAAPREQWAKDLIARLR